MGLRRVIVLLSMSSQSLDVRNSKRIANITAVL